MSLQGQLLNLVRGGVLASPLPLAKSGTRLSGTEVQRHLLRNTSRPLSEHLTDSNPKGLTTTSPPLPHPFLFSRDNNEAETISGKGIDLFIYHLLIKSFLPPVKIPMISFAESNRSVLRD